MGEASFSDHLYVRRSQHLSLCPPTCQVVKAWTLTVTVVMMMILNWTMVVIAVVTCS